MKYSGTVENVGTIIDGVSKTEAIRRVKQCIKHSMRTDKYGFVMNENGELVWERGQPACD